MGTPKQRLYDFVIVGGGAAGLTAALYSSRREMKTLIISQDVGGQAATTPDIENYPGIVFSHGVDLMETFKKQAEHFGAELVFDSVNKIEKLDDGSFGVHANSFVVQAEAVLLAFGLSHRHLEIPGEEEMIGKGVTYCATCDAPLYKGKNVTVVGGGNCAMDAAILLSKIAKTVIIVNKNSEFRGESVLMDKIKAASNITTMFNTNSKAVLDKEKKGRVSHLVVADVQSKKETEIPTDGIFVEIGFTVNADWIKGLVDLDERKQIKITPNCETNVPGIFAAGDVTTVEYKQVVISAGEGAKAALQAHAYVMQKSGKRTAFIDWGKKK